MPPLHPVSSVVLESLNKAFNPSSCCEVKLFVVQNLCREKEPRLWAYAEMQTERQCFLDVNWDTCNNFWLQIMLLMTTACAPGHTRRTECDSPD